MTLRKAGALLAVTLLVVSATTLLAEAPRPKPRPLAEAAIPASMALPPSAPEPAPGMEAAAVPATEAAVAEEQAPTRGAVTNLPLPRYVSLKTNEGNARRGPGLTHRIDWVFTKAGMPLKITAEFENWRRVEDVDGLGGWVHYSLLSGVRTAIVRGDLVDFHTSPRSDGPVAFRAEAGVVGRILSCASDWCRLQIEGQRGWAPITALWGVDPGETID